MQRVDYIPQKTHDRIKLASIGVVLFFALVMLPNCAHAIGINELLTWTPLDYVSAFVIQISCSLINDVLSPLTQVLFDWSTDYLTIPYINTVIIALQGLAIVAVIAVRIGVGISNGILLRGGNREQSLGEYLFKSVVAIIIVALMPMLCRTMIQFGSVLYGDIVGGGGTLADTLKFFVMGDNFNIEMVADLHGGPVMWLIVGVLTIMILCIACGYQFIRRQVEMLTVSIIGPLVSIYAATENDSDQVWTLLKNLFGLVCMQWLQYLLVQIALAFGIAWMTASLVSGDVTTVFTPESAKTFMFCLATFMAALTVPNLVDQYTFGSGGSRAGSVAVGAVVSGAMRRPFGRFPRR